MLFFHDCVFVCFFTWIHLGTTGNSPSSSSSMRLNALGHQLFVCTCLISNWPQEDQGELVSNAEVGRALRSISGSVWVRDRRKKGPVNISWWPVDIVCSSTASPALYTYDDEQQKRFGNVISQRFSILGIICLQPSSSDWVKWNEKWL